MKKEIDSIPYFSHKTVTTGKTLVLAPHPDDEVFGCGGAIIRHLEQRDEVKVVIVTDGGYPVNESQKVPEYPEIRKRESLEAAKVLGYGQPEFLDFKDEFLKADEKLIVRLREIILLFQPQNIYLPANTEIHPDHLALNKAGIEAAIRSPENFNLFFYEIGQPLRPNLFLDITQLQPRLDQAMDCFTSQLAVQDYKTHIRSLHAYRSYTLGRDVKFAEAYRLIKSNELKTGDMLWQEKQLNEIEKLPISTTTKDFPLISVIVRTMNRPELPEALESIAAQTYPNIEVIVVDARGEKPLDLGKTCGKFPLRVITKGKPLNRPAAANAGLDAVKGEFFSFLDEDDLLLPDHIMLLHNSLAGHGEAAAYSIIKKIEMDTGEALQMGSDFNFNDLLRENFIPIHAILFNAGILKKGCHFDPDFDIYEDWDFLIQAAHHGNFIFVEKETGIYRNFGSSSIHEHLDKVYGFRKKMYLKWIPLLSDEQFNALIPAFKDSLRNEILQIERENQQEIDKLKEVHKMEVHKHLKHTNDLETQIENLQSNRTLLENEIASIKQSHIHKFGKKLSGVYHSIFQKKPTQINDGNLLQSKNLKIIRESGLFNEHFYLHNNPDVQQSEFDPLLHYLNHGGFEGRNPSEYFDSAFYLKQYPDVKTANINPLLHYLLHGQIEDRLTRPEIFRPIPFVKEKFLKHKQAELFDFLQSSEQIDLTWPEPQISVIVVLYNQAELTYACMKSLQDYADVPLEIIVIDNHSTDQTEHLLKKIKVSHVIRNSENLHFLKACNQALDFVSTGNILFLNNDTEISKHAISSALATLNENEHNGAVGAKLILPDGSLQEAGNIIWRDGSCQSYGRGDDPALPEYNFRRYVDYCSGAFLLTRTSLFKKHGGFDTQFAPAYYEETDYCLWLQENGFRVVYNPFSEVYHLEFGSSDKSKSVELQVINREKFLQKHGDTLNHHFEPANKNVLNARFSATFRPKGNILYIDDKVPHASLGSGYPRSKFILNTFSKLGYFVTMYPNTFPQKEEWASCYKDVEPAVEVIFDMGTSKFEEFIQHRSEYYDFIWISRPHNLRFLYNQIDKYRNQSHIIYDAEAIFAKREFKKKILMNPVLKHNDFLMQIEEEINLCRIADHVIAVSEQDVAEFNGSTKFPVGLVVLHQTQ
jgi:GT2 family glycosyltransferase/LmbE family N-acetylglucosaminyl deacetylase